VTALDRGPSAWPERENSVFAEPPGHATDAELAGKCGIQLAWEARLLDERRLEEWLELYAAECLYWVPTSATKGPGNQMAIAYEDRRRLEDRVAWLGLDSLHAQDPHSRTMRSITNVEAWEVPAGRLVRSHQTLREYRNGDLRSWYAQVEHRMVPFGAGDWRIERKTVLLLGYDAPVRNIAFIF
jgi:benzoate/toluate 1,2-dioxygenase beta subunit